MLPVMELTPDVLKVCYAGLCCLQQNTPVRWEEVYALLEVHGVPDCQVRCKHALAEPLRQLCRLTGKSEAWCCSTSSLSGVNLITLAESEQEYLSDNGCEDAIVYQEGVPHFLCLPLPCPREFRPFMCRAAPYLPVLSAQGQIIGVTNGHSYIEGSPCDLKWEEYSEEFQQKIVSAWEIVLAAKDGRELYFNFVLDPLMEEVTSI